jgi:kinesin family protein C2/C3
LGGNLSPTSGITRFGSPRGDASSIKGHFSPTFGEEKRKFSPESKSQQALGKSCYASYGFPSPLIEIYAHRMA